MRKAEAILAWAVEGTLRWQQEGLLIPERVKEYTEEYRAENDPVADFFEERCLFKPTAAVRRSELYQAYERWAQANGERAVPSRTFAQALRQLGANDGKKLHGDRAWQGVTLRDLEPPPEALGDPPF